MKNQIIILSAVTVFSCSGQATNRNATQNNMVETFDFAEYERRVNNDPENGASYMKPDGTLVEENYSSGKWAVRWEIAPKPTFVKVYKEFYPNGNMKRKETYFGQRTMVDTSLYFDEKGNLTKTVDENSKFGKIKPEDILRFLEEKNRIDIETGEGVFDTENHETFEALYNEDNNVWHVTIVQGRQYTPVEMLEIMKNSKGDPNHWKPFRYEIDGNTGEVISADEDMDD